CLIRFREHFDNKVLRWLLISILLTILSELSFTTYASVYGFSNLLGHYFKIASFYMIYKAIIETGLSKPYDLLFRDLNRQREWLRVTLGSIGDAVIATNTTSRVTFINTVASDLTAWSPDEALGQPIRNVLRTFNELTRDPAEEIVEKVLKQGSIVNMANHTALRSRDGREIPIEDSAAPIKDGQGRVIGAVVVFHDITQRRKAEEAMRRSTAKYELLSSTSGRLLATDDPQGTLQELCNEVMTFMDCQAFFNFIVDEAAGKLHLNACASIPEAEARKIEWLDYGVAVCGCVARDRQRIIAEDILNTHDLRTELVKSFGIQAYCCHPLMDQDRLIGTLSFGTTTRAHFTSEEVELMRTVAGQAALAMQRIQAQQRLKDINEELEHKVNERTAELASNLKELRTANERLNLRAVQLRALAGELTTAEQRERKRLSKILHDGLQQHLAAAKLHLGCITFQLPAEGLKKAAAEVEEMLAESIQISRSLSAELSPPALFEGGLAGGLKWLVRWMREKHNFSVDLSIENNVELREDVKVLLFESVRELLFNAAKYARVSCARVKLGHFEKTGVLVTVSDDGVGFEPDRLNPTAAIGGGFGLFSIRERIGLIGGRLEIESSPGKGSCFAISVENCLRSETGLQADAAGVVVEADSDGVSEQGRAIRVVLVDDHAIFREGLARLLSREPDMQVVAHAKDALEAIDLARKLKPHVILMDVDMPDINGMEATRIIQQMSLGTRIIGLSMYDEAERGREMRQAGAVAYKNKGCAASELVEAIRACVHDDVRTPVIA
ncbi:MAG: response regulator, partial [Planctomycetaceae bacterium]